MIQPATAPAHPHWTPATGGRNANAPQALSRAWPFMARREAAPQDPQRKPSWQDTGS